MADVRGRKKKERELREAILSELQRFAALVGAAIPQLNSASDRLAERQWFSHAANLTAIISPRLLQTFTDQAETLLTEIPFVTVDWALVNQSAVRWAREYTFELIRDLNLTSERAVREAITSFFEQGWEQDDLTQVLARTFGEARAQRIAVTETTRAAVEGEKETVRQLAAESGIQMRPIWLTANDERVCPICGPRNEKEITPNNVTRGLYPPAHPNCRCGVGHEIIS